MRTLLPATLLLVACSSTHVAFERNATKPSGVWALAIGQSRVEVKAEGNDTTVSWRNRTLLFRGFDTFRGTIDAKGADLVGARMSVRVRDNGVTVTTGASDTFQPIDAIPEGEVSVWRDGRWVLPKPPEPIRTEERRPS